MNQNLCNSLYKALSITIERFYFFEKQMHEKRKFEINFKMLNKFRKFFDASIVL